MSRLLRPDEVDAHKQMVKDYVLHDDVLSIFQKSNFAIIAGPAGAGKDTLRYELIRRFPEIYLPILSTTTRPMRTGEANGVDYHFIELEAFEEGLRQQKFFMAEVVHDQQISGLDIDEIRKLDSHQWGLSILITRAAQKLSKIKQDTKTIFLIPPDATTLMSRMQFERTLGDDELTRRMEAAKQELEDALLNPNYYCIVTDTIDHAVERAHCYLQGNYADPAYNNEARTAIKQIIDNLSN